MPSTSLELEEERDPMSEIVEAYRKIGDPDDRFDVEFWQRQGPEAIFRAALELVPDAQIVRHGHADEPSIDRTFEYFGRQYLGQADKSSLEEI
jgi:hypothetical protein